MMKKIVILLILAGALGIWSIGYVMRHYVTLNAEPISFIVRRGASINSTMQDLASQELIQYPQLLTKIVRLHYRDRLPIKTGEYEIAAHTSLQQLVDMFIKGKMKKYKLTIPEGLTSYEILRIIRENPVLEGEISIVVQEGDLLPETYVFYRGETRDELIRRMKRAMQEALEVNWEARQPDLPIANQRELLIIASIIEKETALESEMRKVASVFINRLRIKMRLQSCPTVIYAINDGRSSALGRALTFEDLKFSSPYNTYQHSGLPPAPITNPGKQAIAAAANPEPTNYLFFVVDGKGGHHFTSTFTEHVKFANQYRNRRANSGLFIE